ncbi:glutamate mutase L [bacterium]|nr:glutamate mutase L [bacterium]
MNYVISIDIGSTYTKGALFSWQEGDNSFRLESRAVHPTTVDYLPNGFNEVCSQLTSLGTTDLSGVPVYFSSSAKGGLGIAALGIVPALTLKAAKLTALSAGGRIDKVYAYKLTKRDVSSLEAAPPDIILLSGGTEGGNEAYVQHNSRILAKSEILSKRSVLIYAGNSVLADEVEELFSSRNFEVHLAENILPELDRTNTDQARDIIRDIFLRRIVKGRGLNTVVDKIGHDPNPTPFAVLSLVEAIHEVKPEFGEFMLLDMGGATTDVYSCSKAVKSLESVMFRGLPEPEVKRTVEGDLGMRVSALSTYKVAPYLQKIEGMAEFVDKVDKDTSYLGESKQEKAFDAALAGACVGEALRRHAGKLRRVFTAMGEAFVQEGKDLRQVSTIIGSGGYLSKIENFTIPDVLKRTDTPDSFLLVPEEFKYVRDKDYIFPLLGNLVKDYRLLAVNTALESLL